MSTAAFEAGAAANLARILPLDQQTLAEVVKYATALPDAEHVAAHFTELLGETPEALNFISDFCARRWPKRAGGGSKAERKDKGKAAEAPTRAAGSASVAGSAATAKGKGYRKEDVESDYYYVAPKQPKKAEAKPEAAAKQVWNAPTPVNAVKPKKADSSISRAPVADKAGPSHGHGKLASDLLEPKSSIASELKKGEQRRGKRPPLIQAQSLQEVEDAIRELEVEFRDTTRRTICNCQAQRHPLLEIAPNCLSCGKIICLKEGLGPCTFCHTPLLAQFEYDELIAELRRERGQLKTEIGNATVNRAKGSKGGAPSTLKYSEKVGGRAPADEPDQLDIANERLSNLLRFQATAAERTRIVDNASDFELPGITNKWATPAERALQLKKQQQEKRRLDAKVSRRNGRARRVVSIDLRGNKVMVADHSETEYETEDEEPVPEPVANAEGVKHVIWNADLSREGFIKPTYEDAGEKEPARRPAGSSNLERTLAGYVPNAGVVQADVDYDPQDLDDGDGFSYVDPALKLVERPVRETRRKKGRKDAGRPEAAGAGEPE
ncbi:uncharacterized protein V1510DRAFT_272234 [Dipodascopsis tothii]|uniref:uncharacterized protein n=1 Tax=Dipodascopsis tothii TaxID=44089 RepID=UPI0034CFBA61